MREPIYLDHQATTPPDPRVLEDMAPYLGERFGHPASRQHAFGWAAEKALETARARVADLVGAEPREIVFTSGGTEADNLAVRGVAEALEAKGRHVVTTAIENRPVLDCTAWLERRGWQVTRVMPDALGRVAPEAVAAAIRPDTVLVTVEYASHEVGTLQDMAEIGRICAAREVLLHSDATQAAAFGRLDVVKDGVHLLSLSAHRMHGPKGIGALYVRRRRPRTRVAPQQLGGGHENGLRGGTVNVPGAVGFGRAAEICRVEAETDAARLATLRDRLEVGIRAGVADVRLLGDPHRRLPHVTCLAIPGVEGESLLLGVPEIAFATGSACTSATAEPSYVLRAMGVEKEMADASVRFGLGRFTTSEEIERAIARVVDAVHRIRRPPAGPRAPAS